MTIKRYRNLYETGNHWFYLFEPFHTNTHGCSFETVTKDMKAMFGNDLRNISNEELDIFIFEYSIKSGLSPREIF